MIFVLIIRLRWVLLLMVFASKVAAEKPLDQSNCSRWNLFADTLLLRADQIATWALPVTFMPFTTSGGEAGVNFVENAQMVQFNWDFGFRTGLRYGFERQGWDTTLYYTWFRTEGKNNTPTANSLGNTTSALIGEWLSFGFASGTGRIQWNILLNSIDWELGRQCNAGKGMMFRPHLGVKGGWIRQNVHSHWVTTSQILATENLKNNFWGLGPKGGVNSKWRLSSAWNTTFHIFFDPSLALLGGCWKMKDIQKSSSMNSSINSINPTTWAATFMFHSLMGIGWDLKLSRANSNLGFRLGYELQYWFDQFKVFTFLEGTLHAALVLQGGMFDVHFNY